MLLICVEKTSRLKLEAMNVKVWLYFKLRNFVVYSVCEDFLRSNFLPILTLTVSIVIHLWFWIICRMIILHSWCGGICKKRLIIFNFVLHQKLEDEKLLMCIESCFRFWTIKKACILQTVGSSHC